MDKDRIQSKQLSNDLKSRADLPRGNDATSAETNKFGKDMGQGRQDRSERNERAGTDAFAGKTDFPKEAREQMKGQGTTDNAWTAAEKKDTESYKLQPKGQAKELRKADEAFHNQPEARERSAMDQDRRHDPSMLTSGRDMNAYMKDKTYTCVNKGHIQGGINANRDRRGEDISNNDASNDRVIADYAFDKCAKESNPRREHTSKAYDMAGRAESQGQEAPSIHTKAERKH